jgi:hypothetical protein
MPVVFSAKLDGSAAVRYQHVSLVTFYLREARAHVSRSLELERGETQFAEAILGVILSALCLEAFANETGEDLVPTAELEDFFRARKAYRKPDGIGSVARKLVIVFEKKWSHELGSDTGLMEEIQLLFALRNELVHYNLKESAAKVFLPPAPMIADPETGQFMTAFDFEQCATHVEPALVSRADAKAAMLAYNTALRVLKLWNEKAGAPPDALSAHQEFRQ